MHGHADTVKTHAYKNTHALKPAKAKRGVTKDRQCPLVFSSKRNQTKSTNHHPKQSHKNRYRKGARKRRDRREGGQEVKRLDSWEKWHHMGKAGGGG